MTRTDQKVGYAPKGKDDEATSPDVLESVDCAVRRTEEVLRILGGRWKMMIIFHLFAQPVLRFSELERGIPGVSQKMLAQHLRELEHDGVVQRTVHPAVPPKVEYALTELGRQLCPALDALVKWSKLRETSSP